MQLQETIFCASASPAAGAGQGVLSIHDLQAGTSLATFKQSNSAPNCTALVESTSALGGFFLSAQADKSILNIYNFQKDQIALKVVLPEKLSALAVDPVGNYCAGGSFTGRIYLWEIASGILYSAWDAHYRQVTVLRFTSDCQGLISGSEDSSVSLWSVPRLVDSTYQNDVPEPFCSLTNHTLPITDISCGVGPFPKCRLLTASIDHSVKLWDIASRSLLATFQFPRPIQRLVWDVAERFFVGASPEGIIFQVELFKNEEGNGRQRLEAIGGAGLSNILQVGTEDTADRKGPTHVGEPVTSLALSITSSLLVVGTAGGSVFIFDIPSHQRLRTIPIQKGFNITFVTVMQKPRDLVGHIKLNLGSTSGTETKDAISLRPVCAFQKMKEPKSQVEHEATILLPVVQKHAEMDFDDHHEDLLQDHLSFVQKFSSDDSGIALHTRVRELEEQVSHLHSQLQQAKEVNDVMWDNVVQQVIGQGGLQARAEVARKKGWA